MTFKRFKRVIKKHFIFKETNLTKSKISYYSGYVYLKCDNAIRFEVRYLRKKKVVEINTLSYTKTHISISNIKSLELAIIKVYEAVINEYKCWVKYWKDCNNKAKKPTQEDKEKFWEDK